MQSNINNDSMVILGEATVGRVEKFAQRWKWALWLLAPLVIAPLTSLILWGLLGIAALAVAGILSIAAIFYAPVFTEKMKNRRMAALMEEARRHPIETHMNIYLDRKKRIAEAEERDIKFSAAVNLYTTKRIEYEKKHPEDTPTIEIWRNEEKKLLAGVERKRKIRQAANRALADFKEKIDVARDRMVVATAMAGARSLSEDAQLQAWEEVKAEIGFDAIDQAMAQTMAQIDHEMETDANTVSQLPPAIRAELPAMLSSDAPNTLPAKIPERVGA